MANTRESKSAATVEPAIVGAAIRPQAIHFLRAQEKIGGEIEKFAWRWTERRCEAAETLLKAFDEFRQAEPGLAKVPTMLQTWQRTSVTCMAKDANDWLALWSTCAGILTEGEIEAESEFVKMAGMTNENGKLPTRIPV